MDPGGQHRYDTAKLPSDRTIVLRDDRSWDERESAMEFRLTYAGELLASNMGRDERVARKEHKRKLRGHFHHQIKRLYETTPMLMSGVPSGPRLGGRVLPAGHAGPFGFPSQYPYADVHLPRYDKDAVVARMPKFGSFSFLPLVTEELKLACSLKILMLRRQPPGKLWSGGDIDNRLKTLFDALSMPDANQGYESLAPAPDETPLYCLCEKDELISKIEVDTDILLEDLDGKQPNEADVRIVVSVRLQPYEFTLANLMFV